MNSSKNSASKPFHEPFRELYVMNALCIRRGDLSLQVHLPWPTRLMMIAGKQRAKRSKIATREEEPLSIEASLSPGISQTHAPNTPKTPFKRATIFVKACPIEEKETLCHESSGNLIWRTESCQRHRLQELASRAGRNGRAQVYRR